MMCACIQPPTAVGCVKRVPRGCAACRMCCDGCKIEHTLHEHISSRRDRGAGPNRHRWVLTVLHVGRACAGSALGMQVVRGFLWLV